MGVKFNPFTSKLDVVDSPDGDFDSIEVSGDITLDDGGTYTTTVQAVTPTANRTISFPDATGTVALVSGANGTIQYNDAGTLKGNSDFTVDVDWDNPTTTFTALKVNVPDATQGAADSKLLDLQSGGTSKAVIDSSGRLLVGNSSGYTFTTYLGSGISYSQLIGVGTGDTASYAIVNCNQGSGARGPSLILAKNRSASISLGTVSVGENLGEISFQGSASSAFVRAANIQVFQDGGTPSSASMAGRLVFATTADGASSPTERMRIGNNGQVSINTTEVPGFAFFDGKLRVENSGSVITSRCTGAAGSSTFIGWHQATTGDNTFAYFGTEATYNARGSITYNRSGGVVAYNTTSDYRAKTILGDIENSGTTIDAFKVYRGVMNGATVERPMLVAHEAQEVAPYCVTGEKDSVDDNGNPIYQQMDHQVLVPLLIAEIQQLRMRVAALEGN